MGEFIDAVTKLRASHWQVIITFHIFIILYSLTVTFRSHENPYKSGMQYTWNNIIFMMVDLLRVKRFLQFFSVVADDTVTPSHYSHEKKNNILVLSSVLNQTSFYLIFYYYSFSQSRLYQAEGREAECGKGN